MKEQTNNKGNVILLTVIAIVTMVMVVVGATFAYLASSVSNRAESDINASTSGGSDLFLINAGEAIEIAAVAPNAEGNGNFFACAEGVEVGTDGCGLNLSDSTYGSVIYETTSATLSTYNYNIYLNVDVSNFNYSSGTCYGNATPVPSASDETTCVQSATNMWATNGTNYSCYTNGTPISEFTDEISCTINSEKLWEIDPIAELVLDIYREDTALTNESACQAAGKCYDAYGTVTAATSEGACTGTNTWVNNSFENGICYAAASRHDITKAPASAVFPLMNNVEISANNSRTVHNYKTVVTLINFNHNQVVNGNNSFTADLTYERVVE